MSSGYQAAPPSGYQAAPPSGYQAAPTPGYQAAPTPGYQAAPTPGYQAAPPSGYQAAPAQQVQYVHQNVVHTHSHLEYGPPSGAAVFFSVLSLLLGFANVISPLTVFIYFVPGWAFWVELVGGLSLISAGMAVLAHRSRPSRHRRNSGVGGAASGAILCAVAGGFLAYSAAVLDQLQQAYPLQVVLGAAFGLAGALIGFIAMGTLASSSRVIVHH